jgi:solute:Na+ symporter, SSS family
MFGLPWLDLAVIIAYFAVALSIGYIAMKFIKSQEDFFLGGRGFGKFLSIFSAFGQATSSDSAVGTVTTTYRDGASGIWSQLGLLWTTPIYWLTAPWYRRMRLYSLGEFYSERYQSRRMAILYALIASLFLMLIVATSMKALGVTMQGITLKPAAQLTATEQAERSRAERLVALNAQPTLTTAEAAEQAQLRLERPRREFAHLSQTAMVWSVVIVVFAYGLAGGLRGAIWTDVFQGCLIFVLSFMLLPFAWSRLGALYGTSGLTATAEALHRDLPERFFKLMGAATNEQFTWYFIVSLCVMTSINVAVQANQLTTSAPAKNEHTASVGFVVGVLIKRYLTLVWGVVGILCFALYGATISDPDLIWGHATRDLLGSAGFGLVGLMIACLFAALQSTASTLMISASTLLTRDVYLPLVPGRSEAHYILVGRACGAGFLVASALVCLNFDSMMSLMKYMWEFNAVIAASFWCGLKWRGASRRGAWASIGLSLLFFTLLPATLPALFPGLRSATALHVETRPRVVAVEASAPGAAAEAKVTVIPPRAVFWSGGIGLRDGAPKGQGLFYGELYLLNQWVDLSRFPFALNESIRYWFRIVFPFAILILVSRLWPDQPSATVERFFLRMRTKVRDEPAADTAALTAAYAAPDTTRAVLLFPGTRLEFQKLERTDWIGVGTAAAAVALLIIIFTAILNFGS